MSLRPAVGDGRSAAGERSIGRGAERDPDAAPPPGPGHRAAAAVATELVQGANRVSRLRSDPPLTFRPTPDGVVWVGTAAGPIGGDELTLDLSIGPGAALRVTSVGAALVLPGPHGCQSRMTIKANVGDGASLWWLPEPTIVAAGADHRAATVVTVGSDVDLVWVDELVLGRHQEQPGQLRSQLRVEAATGPLLCTGIDLVHPGWDGPAGAVGCRGLAQVLVMGQPARRLTQAWGPSLAEPTGTTTGTGTGCRMAASTLDDGSVLVNVAGPSILAVRRAVAAAVAAAGPYDR